jgi:manganese/iron transport system ATP-binding protein/manganese transport system ATP-binding protein/manganese/zinc/iron transport system ATP- binding protein
MIFRKSPLPPGVLLARKVVAIGAPQDVLTPEALLETFGIVVTGEKRLHVLECAHGHDDMERSGLKSSKR